jgi:hypothetical protein
MELLVYVLWELRSTHQDSLVSRREKVFSRQVLKQSCGEIRDETGP